MFIIKTARCCVRRSKNLSWIFHCHTAATTKNLLPLRQRDSCRSAKTIRQIFIPFQRISLTIILSKIRRSEERRRRKAEGKKFEASLETNEGSTINFKGHCRRFYSWKLVYTISLSAVEESFLPTRCSLFNSKLGFPIKLFCKIFLIRFWKGSNWRNASQAPFSILVYCCSLFMWVLSNNFLFIYFC